MYKVETENGLKISVTDKELSVVRSCFDRNKVKYEVSSIVYRVIIDDWNDWCDVIVDGLKLFGIHFENKGDHISVKSDDLMLCESWLDNIFYTYTVV